jgi:hypothetical protein
VCVFSYLTCAAFCIGLCLLLGLVLLWSYSVRNGFVVAFIDFLLLTWCAVYFFVCSQALLVLSFLTNPFVVKIDMYSVAQFYVCTWICS